MKQTMLWMLGLCMAILPTGRLHAAESTEPAVYDTIFMTWMAEAGVDKPLRVGVTASESWNGGETFWVDFGDGTYWHSSAVDTSFTKTYTEAGSYNVTITVSHPEVRITKFSSIGSPQKSGGVTSLDVSRSPALIGLDCSYNQLTDLDVSKNTALTTLYCGFNRLTSLDVSANTALTYLNCSSNHLTSLDLSQSSALMWLSWDYNQLTVDLDSNYSFDLSTLPGMDVSRIGHVVGGYKDGSRLIFEEDSVTYFYDVHFPVEDLDFPSFKVLLVASERVSPPCDTLFMTWTAKSGWLNGFSFSGTAGETFTVDWGDGSDTVVMGKGTPLYSYVPYDHWLRHRYAEEGAYQVRLSATSQKGRITWFNCHSNGATSLDVGRCRALRELYCHNNQLTSLELSRNLRLHCLYCHNNQLTSLKLPQSIGDFGWDNYLDVECSNNRLSSLDLSACSHLSQLTCHSNELSLLDVSKCVNLFMLGCDSNRLTSLDVSRNAKLEILSCAYNQLTSMDVTHHDSLKILDGSWNHLTELDVTRNAVLTELYCSGNQLASLDVSRNPVLRQLFCYNNQLTSLNVTQNIDLTSLGCSVNPLSSLDVTQNVNLVYLWCSENQLNSLDVTRNDSLTALYCENNQLKSLDVTQNLRLDQLGCGGNVLTSLDLSQNRALLYLWCMNNRLTSLDVSHNDSLTLLGCAGNRLTSLDVSNNTGLTGLGCNNNQLTSLDISRNPALTELHCQNNQLIVDLGADNSFDLSTLTGMEVSRIGSMTGGHLDGSRLFFDEDSVVYHYATHFPGADSLDFDSVAFTLIASAPLTPTDPTLPDTLVPENGVGLIWMASAGEEKEMTFKGTGKGFRVDWGDGNVSEAKGGAAADAAFAMVGADGAASITFGGLAVSASAPAAKDSEKELKHRYAEAGVYTVTLAPLSQNGRLTDLEVSEERVLSLAFGDASMLETLDCSDNLLTELDLPAAAKLKDLDCSDNLLAALDLSGCAALQEADFSDNRLTSLALPTHANLKDVEGEDNRLRLSTLYDLLSGRVKNASYEFDPQSDSVRVAENAVFDLAAEMSIGGRATTYTLLDAATRRPAPASDYAADGGLFRFSKPGARYVLTLENANVTDYEKGRADEVVTFTWYISVSGVGNEGLASDEAATAPWAYVVGRTVYLTSDGLGEVEAFTAVGRRVYRGYDRAFTVPTAGVYVLRAADGRRCKVMVR